MSYDCSRQNGETLNQYIWRMGKAKDMGLHELGWNEIANLANTLFNLNYSEATFRKPYQAAKAYFDDGIFNTVSEDKSVQKQLEEIYKEKQLLFDERRDLNNTLRQQARHEDTINKIESMLKDIGNVRYITYNTQDTMDNQKEMIICLSDLHIGANFYNICGIYNSEIAQAYLKQYLKKIFEIQNTHSVTKCHVLLLGDMISGNIHKNLSVTNKENVIDQVKLACEYIADFVYELGKEFNSVIVHSVSGNHSRIEEKDDALLEERLDELIPWFVESTLHNCQNIMFVPSDDSTLTSFYSCGKLYYGVHGDFDSGESGITKLALWNKEKPYCVLCGHLHHMEYNEYSGIKMVRSGSLCGSGDQFTRQKRLNGQPSQTVLIVDNHGINAIYPIEF